MGTSTRFEDNAVHERPWPDNYLPSGSKGNVLVRCVQEQNLVTAPVDAMPCLDTVATVLSGTPIAEKLVAKMKRQVRGKVTNLKHVIAGRALAEELQRTVVTAKGLAGYHPAHAAYVYAQNQVSVMSEQLTALDDMAPFASLVSEAEELYLPSGPPMSPLTTSYFTCWAFFDACVGPGNETIGTTVLAVGTAFGMPGALLHLVQLMQQSRMGVYVHEGTEGGLVVLRELLTGAVCRAIVPAGYGGREGELWFARVLPPPFPGGAEHVVFTTPYILLQPGLAEWTAYFSRMLPQGAPQARIDAYQRHMKYGPTRRYWNDFVFEGYVNHRSELIFLAGLPDVPDSRPHSAQNSGIR